MLICTPNSTPCVSNIDPIIESLHKYGDFFPGTGHVKDTGAKEGTGFSVNAPLSSGMTDEAYEKIFKPVASKIMEVYQPGAVVLQCGADSLTGDRLGCFNLSLKGHAECVKFVKVSFFRANNKYFFI